MDNIGLCIEDGQPFKVQHQNHFLQWTVEKQTTYKDRTWMEQIVKWNDLDTNWADSADCSMRQTCISAQGHASLTNDNSQKLAIVLQILTFFKM